MSTTYFIRTAVGHTMGMIQNVLSDEQQPVVLVDTARNAVKRTGVPPETFLGMYLLEVNTEKHVATITHTPDEPHGFYHCVTADGKTHEI